MSEIQLGEIITTPQERDAIHIAVVPVTAMSWLSPGSRVGVNDARTHADTCYPHIGVVDPFLRRDRSVEPGQQFWLFLFPNTVTGMRHHWTHPVFDENPVESRENSEQWLREFAKNNDCPDFDDLISAATGRNLSNVDPKFYAEAYVNDGEYLLFNGRDAHGRIPPEFWKHLEIYTGVKIPEEKKPANFSCSC
jgi:hypothetical protein